MYGHFKRQTSDISYEETWTSLRKGNLKRETESLLITTQNNAIRNNHIKARIDKTQQNSKCRLCGEMINHIIIECSKLTQKEYKTRHDCVGKVIDWEFSKKFKFDHMDKCCTHNTQTSIRFWHTNGLSNLGQTNRLYNNQQKKKRLKELWTSLSRLIT